MTRTDLTNPAPDRHESGHHKKWIALALAAGLSAAFFFGFIMYRMVNLMEEMTGHVAEMASNTSSMNKVMVHMGQDFHLMQDEMTNISTRIMLMDTHMFMMNRSISSIQTRLADNLGHMKQDMELMVVDVDKMTGAIGLMSSSVHNMSQDVRRMGYDIYRGSSSFTSPPSFLRNMMNPH